jgi:hypothetical protein
MYIVIYIIQDIPVGLSDNLLGVSREKMPKSRETNRSKRAAALNGIDYLLVGYAYLLLLLALVSTSVRTIGTNYQ